MSTAAAVIPSKTSKKRARPEDALQRAVVAHLRYRRAAGVSWFAVPNGGYRSGLEASIMQGLGTRAGIPDLFFVVEGRPYGLELKAAKGRLSPAQIAMHLEMRKAGVTVETAFTVDQAVQILQQWGAIRDTQR